VVFENRILGRIFGPKRDQNEEWRRLNIVCTIHLIYSEPLNLARARHLARKEVEVLSKL
jgi:hypothetical protein